MRHALEMLNVKKSYLKNTSEAEKALNDLTLKIPKGSVFGLLGPNGAGKSTAINILAGLTIKSGGKVQIWGHDQDVFPQKTRACLGVVPQELNLDPFLTPRESLEIQAGLFGVPKAERKTDHILTKVGLIGVSDAYSRSLSGGMRRRLLIAKALVHDPPILVLDEPTAGVDIELREMLWDYVKELNLCGTTVILTTHYLQPNSNS
jgi:ABC-2 type transport system ATP-binding protein